LDKRRAVAEIDGKHYQAMVNALGHETIQRIAQVDGPEAKAALLKALGMKTMLITDGKSPLNLWNTAHDLLEGSPARSP
jgi:major vault protein